MKYDIIKEPKWLINNIEITCPVTLIILSDALSYIESIIDCEINDEEFTKDLLTCIQDSFNFKNNGISEVYANFCGDCNGDSGIWIEDDANLSYLSQIGWNNFIPNINSFQIINQKLQDKYYSFQK